jgi:hypothetical protein
MSTTSQGFDRQLFTRKLSEPARQMQIESLASVKAARSIKLGGSVLVRIVEGQLGVLRRWLETVDGVCREVWRTQGETITLEFVRKVLMLEAMTAIGARSAVANSLIDRTTRQTHEDPYAARHHLTMEVNRLKGEVNNRYEIEARALEHRNALTGGVLNPRNKLQEASQPGSVSQEQANLWKDFHDRFMQLAKEETGIVQATMKDSYLRAYCTYEQHPEVFEIRRDAAWAFVLFDSSWDQHREKPRIIDEVGPSVRGPFCLLKTPECGVWMLSDGVSENFLERFQALAARGGVALRVPLDSDPTDRWLHWLFDYLLGNKSKQLFAAERGKGGIILRVCEASATFCSRLERKALEQSELGNASRIASPDRNSANSGQSVDRKPTTPTRRKPERSNPEIARRVALICCNPNVPAKEICEILDREKETLPVKWRAAGFKSWVQAYRDRNYRGRIQTLFSKAKPKA